MGWLVQSGRVDCDAMRCDARKGQVGVLRVEVCQWVGGQWMDRGGRQTRGRKRSVSLLPGQRGEGSNRIG